MRIFLACILILLAMPSFAQIRIEGRLKHVDGKPVEFANVLLFNEQDTVNVLNGTITDSLGNFLFTGIPKSGFILKIHCIGYISKRLTVAYANQSFIQLGTITLLEDSKQLQTVTIVGKKALIQQTNNGFVINADGTLTQQGGTAADLLRGTPTVFVDAEGNISLRGKIPMVLINGRNSKFDNLNGLPASSIEKIEIVTSPGANYDAEAENGIINIIFKKIKAQGFNGSMVIGSGVGASWRFNSSAMLNYKKGNWNTGISYDNRLAERNRKAEGDRINFFLPNQYFLFQRRNDERQEGVHNFRGNIDYVKGKNIIGAEFLVGLEKEQNDETLFSTFENENKFFVSKNRRFSDEGRNATQGELALKYERKLNKDEQVIIFNLSNSFSNGIERTFINTQNLTSANEQIGLPYLQRTSFSDNSFISNVRVDYIQKIGRGIFETGYKTLLRFFDNDFVQENNINGNYIIEPSLTGTLKFREQVHALYAQYKLQWKKGWDFELGLRGEQTINNGKIESLQSQFNNSYYNQFYNGSAGYVLTEQQTIRLSFAKRINRPRLGQLNPFTDITDSLTQRSGNPKLQPEISHNLELTHSLNFKHGNLLSRIYVRNSKNSILPFTILNSNGVLFTQPINIGTTITTGFEEILSYKFFPFWNTNLSFSLFNQKIDAKNIQIDAVNNVWSWNAKWINDFNLNKRTQLQVLSVYTSPVATIQGKTIAIYNTDIALQHKIWREKARIGLIITDIFNTQNSGTIWNTSDFTFNRIFKVDTRAALLTFAYTFGTTFKEKLMENKFSND